VDVKNSASSQQGRKCNASELNDICNIRRCTKNCKILKRDLWILSSFCFMVL